MADNLTPLERNQFTFYKSFEEAISMIPEDEQLKLYRGISRYSLFGEDPDEMPESLSMMGKLAWNLIFPILQSARRKSESGSKGGTRSKVNNPNGTNQFSREVKQGEEVKQDKGKGKGKGKDKDKDKKKESEREHTHAQSEDEKKYGEFLKWIEEKTPYIAEHMTPPTFEEFARLRKAVESYKIGDICLSIENRKDLRCKYSNLYRTIVKWLDKEDS